MTRPILAALISAALLFGAYSYIEFANSVRVPTITIEEEKALGEYRAVITRTFDCEGNAEFDIESLLVRFRGEVILERKDQVPAGETIVLGPLTNVLANENSLFVSASPADSADMFAGFDEPAKDASLPRAVRIRIFRDQYEIADETLWQQPGAQSITGTVVFDTESNTIDDHQH